MKNGITFICMMFERPKALDLAMQRLNKRCPVSKARYNDRVDADAWDRFMEGS
jgi:hypothetical protein